jgi:hypothetical protein
MWMGFLETSRISGKVYVHTSTAAWAHAQQHPVPRPANSMDFVDIVDSVITVIVVCQTFGTNIGDEMDVRGAGAAAPGWIFRYSMQERIRIRPRAAALLLLSVHFAFANQSSNHSSVRS